MKHTLLAFSVLVSLSSMGQLSFAAEKANKGDNATETKAVYRRRYGMAGCGIGSILVKDKNKEAQLGVWAINYLATSVLSCFSPTYAMTSGTSNCTDAPLTSDEAEAARSEQRLYIATNLTTLAKDAARGEGETLTGLAQVFGCESLQADQRFHEISRANYSTIFATEDADSIRAAYLQALDANLCQRLI